MPKTVAASEAKLRLGEVLAWVEKNRDTVIVENRGLPKAAIVPYGDYAEFAQFKEQQRRRKVWETLENLRQEIQARPANKDLTSAEAEQIAVRFSREVINEMVQEGKIRFKNQ